MVDYRIYERAGAFDGLTDETAVYRQNRFLYTTTTTTNVGIFPPSSIGRVNTASLVQVRCDGTPGPLDVVEVLSPLGLVRVSVPLELASNAFLFLEPNDRLRIFGLTTRQAQILVNDLTDEQLSEYSSAQAAAQVIAAGVITNIATLVATGPTVLTPPATDLLVYVATAAADTITLPPIATTAIGRRIMFVRVAADAPTGPPKIVPQAPGTDQVNGVFTLNDFYILRSGDSVTFTRVPGGWLFERGTSSVNRLVSAAAIVAAPAQSDGTLYVTLQGPGADLQLSSLASNAIGVRVLAVNEAATPITVTPAGAETINGAAGALSIDPGGSVLLENNGSEWVAVSTRDPSPAPVFTGAALVAVPAWTGTSMFTGTAGGQTFGLPLAASVRPSSPLVVLNASLAPSQVAPALGETINGLTGPRNLNQRQAMILHSNGINGWQAVGGTSAPAFLVTAASVPIPSFFDGPACVKMTGGAAQTLTLPQGATQAPGSTVVVWNSTAGVHDVAAFAGDTINGLANIVIPVNETAIFVLADATNWIVR